MITNVEQLYPPARIQYNNEFLYFTGCCGLGKDRFQRWMKVYEYESSGAGGVTCWTDITGKLFEEHD